MSVSRMLVSAFIGIVLLCSAHAATATRLSRNLRGSSALADDLETLRQRLVSTVSGSALPQTGRSLKTYTMGSSYSGYYGPSYYGYSGSYTPYGTMNMYPMRRSLLGETSTGRQLLSTIYTMPHSYTNGYYCSGYGYYCGGYGGYTMPYSTMA